MKHFDILLFAFSLEAAAAAERADRTITWRPWQEWAEFRVRTGDRYLEEECPEHYLAFGLYRPSTKRIKISMIYLGTELVSDVEIAPGKTLRHSQSHQLKDDRAQRPLAPGCTGGAIKGLLE